MKTICGWCLSPLGHDDADDGLVSHGICEQCRDRMLGAAEECGTVEEYIDSLPVPVLLIDDEGIVETANQAACRALGKELSAIRRSRGGDAMECAFARLPEGCGMTVHCTACTIRRTVMETHRTGRPADGVVAHQDLVIDGRSTPTRVRIGTALKEGVVLLRIDGIEPAA